MAASALGRLPPSSSSPSSPSTTPSSPSSGLPHLHNHPLAQSEITLPLRDRRSTPTTAAASLFRSTLTPPGSRSASPASSRILGPRSPARSSATFPSTMAAATPTSSTPTMAGSVFGGTPATLKTQSLLDHPAAENPGDPLGLMLRSFVPHVAIHTSEDVDELVADKGFARAGAGGTGGGLWELLRPFGEHVQGKVVVRDSNGAGKAWEDFALRFVRFGEGIEEPEGAGAGAGANGQAGAAAGAGQKPDALGLVEKVVERHLRFAEEAHIGVGGGFGGGAASPPLTPLREDDVDADATSPYYALYLRRLLSGMPLACHESFAHPVACVMAISSRNPAPIEALQRLYRETTSQGERGLPPWVDGEYLRYYVLVHDEEKGDITKSMALFDQMKRNFGLHCHLLRLRSSQSAETDDDSIPLPRSDWMTAAEELADIEESDFREDFEDPTRYIFESDATAIRTFVREMVTQSLVPTMERNVSVWNDQVASRRRGISGRFMSLSKKWTFGGSSRSSTGGSSSSNYDALGFYRADSPEAIMRRLADFAFMLRDWKLAMSTYDLLRADFQNDKAWRYHAAANEMAALALLIMPQSMSSKTRLETITQLLEHAFYSYHIRCASLPGAARCTLLAMELLRLRGGAGVDEAVQWGVRMLEARLTGPVGDALLRERMAVCYASKRGAGSRAWGARRRKAALWSVLAAEAWVAMGKHVQARRCVGEARAMYARLPGECGVQNFAVASDFLAELNDRLKEGLRGDGAGGAGEDLLGGDLDGKEDVEEEKVDVERETLGNKRRSRRTSLINPVAGGAGLETAPLKDMAAEGGGDAAPDDGFG
ncbi:ER-golgi trafficking TRAPP I complex 85 kDa subunit-domain-containing protein [Staphylotrichum tortipilum]|uniref:ER-golgi trafficking TRAPP I complex 85 kDa subunit-domain-containing protein n=1 Tax=Staphylotrichum tortipilum TaxID=2831512 RepID=A0AAN6RT07_9PEZI|nr:ER-golgi trafficking TRAPP I complex 85 kDa subunit-domain-containing protein [Staphylotrichum longicolle]